MEKINLNDRLLTAVPFIREGKKFADIGTDHAYLPIYLLSIGKIESAIAADINKGPIEKADENIKKYGFDGRAKVVLCDGLSKISSCEADDIAIFGMGGELIVKIIDAAEWLKCPDKRIILQPMTHPEKLREYLAKEGYRIVGETLSLDRGKIYQTICAEYDGIAREFDDFTLTFGYHILSEGGALLHELLLSYERQLKRRIQGKAEGSEDAYAEKALLDKIRKYIER